MGRFERKSIELFMVLVHKGASTEFVSARLLIRRRSFDERVGADCCADQVIGLILESVLVTEA